MINLEINPPSVFIGILLTALGTGAVEYIKHYLRKQEQLARNKKILKALEIEIEEGIKRCNALIRFKKNEKVSFSRIYIAFWDSAKLELCQNIRDIEILRTLHKNYYRFDLVNFNMGQGRLGPGAAFAEEYIEEIKKNYKKFINALKPYLKENKSKYMFFLDFSRKILGILILLASALLIFYKNVYLPGIAVFIVSTFGLLALSMNYKRSGAERNSWDIWFFSMPGALIALIFVGILGNDIGVWRWVAIAIGSAIGLESLSSFIKNRKKNQ